MLALFIASTRTRSAGVLPGYLARWTEFTIRHVLDENDERLVMSSGPPRDEREIVVIEYYVGRIINLQYAQTRFHNGGDYLMASQGKIWV